LSVHTATARTGAKGSRARCSCTSSTGAARLRPAQLQTGSWAFVPAQRLYASFGFTRCAPFADYVADPNSVFMTRELTGEDVSMGTDREK
jgi:putative acetyltransferase